MKKSLLVLTAVVVVIILEPAMAQIYSAPGTSSAPGYDWRDQRGGDDWRNNTWRDQRFNDDWRNNSWRQQRLNEDWKEREDYDKRRIQNDATGLGYGGTVKRNTNEEDDKCGNVGMGAPRPCPTEVPTTTAPTEGR